ncbi:MAG: cupin domain-containing protein [Chitinophagales bacterium]|nr:cupin domain-containing protein [Chitinophagales bacterium]OJV25496.1 MAG: hypothetical protein BGO32_00300 [Bacteroidetes bacterium 37-13]HRN93488.1 cupin domain-containing protein [Chitinophagales bacterium]HRP38079.1 cupin domain-containing protein [Chitinophagales bacterium]
MSNKVVPAQMEWHEGQVKNFFGKDLLKVGNGTVKVVKVAPLAEYPAHRHPDKTEFVYVLSGNPSFLIGNEEYDAQPNEFYIFPTRVNHAISNKTNSECLLLVGGIKNELE